jgi:uncharacterized membrane protein
LISTVVYASVSLSNSTVLGLKINVDNDISVIVLARLSIIIGVDGAIGAIV